jgi:hypothetical protein
VNHQVLPAESPELKSSTRSSGSTTNNRAVGRHTGVSAMPMTVAVAGMRDN